MSSDVKIASQFTARPIGEIAGALGVHADDLLPYGREIGKVHLQALHRPRTAPGPSKLILVSALTPTPAGEGKTTTSIGLAQALSKLGESVCLALREPSLGPCMGVKGGACGGGYSQVMPLDRINLHFTGDFHAITSAHNLIAALIDNHIHFGNELEIDPRRVAWPRVMDMNDRSLRNIVVGLGGRLQGMPREDGFDITAASELMAMLCLAEGPEDLRARIDRAIIGYTRKGRALKIGELGSTGAVMALLRDALHPNLVQTLEGTPAFIHGGPFANIAHGCNSVIATRMASHLAEWCVTEAGFGFDLGAEKFFDIKCRSAGLDPAAVVLVATVRALKMHGGKDKSELSAPDAAAVAAGMCNLEKHIESAQSFGKPTVVALNRFASDTEEELAIIQRRCAELGVPVALAEHHARGGEGAITLAEAVRDVANSSPKGFEPAYRLEQPIQEKIRAVARRMYGARDVLFTKEADRDIRLAGKRGHAGLPVCIAKTQSSLSDDPSRRGRPTDFDVTVRNVQVNAGAGFLVVLTGNIMRMPGLPRQPMSEQIDLVDGQVVGLS